MESSGLRIEHFVARTAMQSDPIVGVFLHALGGLMSAIFCLPFRYIRHWAWESYWLVGGIFSWIVADVPGRNL